MLAVISLIRISGLISYPHGRSKFSEEQGAVFGAFIVLCLIIAKLMGRSAKKR